MKQRSGFVSNSSSASFIISTKNLTPDQIYCIFNHEEWAKLNCSLGKAGWNTGDFYFDNSWEITWENDDTIFGESCMDNFGMEDFLNLIGIPQESIISYHND